MLEKNNYILWLIESFVSLIKDIQKQKTFAYRIVDWKKSENLKEDKLVIQVVGKSLFLSLSPSEISQDNAMLSGFSSSDVKTIVTLSFIPTSPKYKVKYTDFRNKLNEAVIGLQDNDDKKKMVRKKLSEFAKQINLINELSPKDAFFLGRLIGNREAFCNRK